MNDLAIINRESDVGLAIHESMGNSLPGIIPRRRHRIKTNCGQLPILPA